MDNLEKEQQFYINENGFTLVETVVSMSLFLAVFIPLLVSVGNIMMDNKSDILRHATVLAESEMNQAALMQDFEEKEKITENFIIERKIETAAEL